MLTGKKKARAMADKTVAIGGEGASPEHAVKALAASLKGATGMLLVERAGGRLFITLGPNDRQPTEGSTFPVLPWKASAKIGEESSTAPRTVWGHAQSEDAERYSGIHATREEAIAEGLTEYGGEPFYILAGTKPTPESLMPTARQMIEDIEQRAYDNHDAAEDWDANVSAEAKAELEELLGAWARKHIKVEFWDGVGSPERIEPEKGATTAAQNGASS